MGARTPLKASMDQGALADSRLRLRAVPLTREGFAPYGEEARTLVRGGHGSFGESRRVSRMPAMHPEGYIEAFANLYCDAAEIVRAHRRGEPPDPARAALVPDVVAGARGVKFVAAAVASNASSGAWPPARL